MMKKVYLIFFFLCAVVQGTWADKWDSLCMRNEDKVTLFRILVPCLCGDRELFDNFVSMCVAATLYESGRAEYA